MAIRNRQAARRDVPNMRTLTVLAGILTALALLAGCGDDPEPAPSLPVARYPAPPASADSGFGLRVSQAGLGRLNAATATAAGRGVCDALYAGSTRQEAIDAGARQHQLNPGDMAIIADVAVEVYCPELG